MYERCTTLLVLLHLRDRLNAPLWDTVRYILKEERLELLRHEVSVRSHQRYAPPIRVVCGIVLALLIVGHCQAGLYNGLRQVVDEVLLVVEIHISIGTLPPLPARC